MLNKNLKNKLAFSQGKWFLYYILQKSKKDFDEVVFMRTEGQNKSPLFERFICSGTADFKEEKTCFNLIPPEVIEYI